MKRRHVNKWFPISMILVISLFLAVEVMAQGDADNADAAGSRESVFSLIRKGGPVMIPLGICSVLALAIAVERFIGLKHDKIIPTRFILGLREAMTLGSVGQPTLTGNVWGQASTAKGVQYCERNGGSAGNIFKAGMLKLSKGEEAVEKAIEDAGNREVDKMKRSLRGLSTIATVSPLLGLLGTVYGMISAFQTASSVGMGKADVLAKGIYEALVTTATGLTIAIPVLLVYQYLNTRVDSLVDEMDEMGIEFMASCVGNEKGKVT